MRAIALMLALALVVCVGCKPKKAENTLPAKISAAAAAATNPK